MKLRDILLVGSFVFSALVYGQDRKKIEFVEYDLPNGLHVILHEDHSTPIVAVTMLYKVGSKNENVGRTGFAHFFEHLMFEGTKHIDRHQFDKYVEGAGGALNANTTQDRTFYYELLPSNQLELGLWLESERLLHAKVENIGIETQREVVKEEKRQRMDNQPYGSFMDEIFKRAFKEHPYKWTPIGSMEDLGAAQEEDYVNFYRTFYVPNNATLSIAGDINIDQAKAWIQKYFATIPTGEKLNIYRDREFLSLEAFQQKYATQLNGRETSKDFLGDWHNNVPTEDFIKTYFPKASTTPNPVPRPTVKEGLLTAEIKDTVYDNIQLPAIFMAYRTPELNHKDHYALQMLSMILSQGNSSRLNKHIVEKQQLAMVSVLVPFPLEDPGIMLSFTVASMGVEMNTLQTSIDKEIEALQTELITEEEFEKLHNMIESDFITSNSTMAGIAESLADYHTYQGSASLINSELDKYFAVTREDIRNAAKTYLVNSNRVVLYYMPKQQGE
jgi:predicted Zn-dependent peptidase